MAHNIYITSCELLTGIGWLCVTINGNGLAFMCLGGRKGWGVVVFFSLYYIDSWSFVIEGSCSKMIFCGDLSIGGGT